MKPWQELLRTFRETKSSSDRTFGLVFAAFFLVLAGRQWVKLHHVNPVWFVMSALCLVAALALPRLLHPLNRAWTFLGLLLGFFVSPVVIGLIYWGIFSPFAVLARLVRGDHLGLKFDRKAKSYWTDRVNNDEGPERFQVQF